MEQQDSIWSKPFVTLIGCGFLLFLNLQMVIMILPAYLKQSFSTSDMNIGVITGAFALAAIGARLYIGRPAIQPYTTRWLIIGFLITAAATTGAIYAISFTSMLLIRVIYGIGFGITSTLLPTLASHYIPSYKMGEGMGIFGFSNTLGLCLGPVAGMLVTEQYGFHVCCIVACALLLPALLISIIFPYRATTIAKELTKQQSAQSAVNRYFSRALLLPVGMNILLSITYSGLVAFIVLFGAQRSIEGAALFFLIQSLMVLLIRPFSGQWFDKYGPAVVLVPGGSLVLLGLLLLSVAHSSVWLFSSSVLYGCGYGFIQPSLQAWMIKKVPIQERGIASSMFFNSIDIGVLVGSIVLGVLAAQFGYAGMYQLSSLAMMFFLVGALVAWRKQRAVNNG